MKNYAFEKHGSNVFSLQKSPPVNYLKETHPVSVCLPNYTSKLKEAALVFS